MGTFGESTIRIELESQEDVEKVENMLADIENIVSKELNQEVGFDLSDTVLADDEFAVYTSARSPRYPNAQWQAEQIAEQLKKMIEREEIETVIEFRSILMVENDGIYMDEDDFKRNLKVVK